MNQDDREPRAEPPERVGPYRIDQQLGVGGMGEVYRAFDERLERWVAMKHILPGEHDDQSAWELLRREARAVASLSHPSIVRIHDILESGSGDWIVMELIEGQTLHNLVRSGPLPTRHVLEIGREVAEGLAAAHVKGIVHRDLKSENVMVTPDGHAKILDFGLAKRVQRDQSETSFSQHGWIQGTGRAMAPEQINGLPVDHRSDLFSFGSLLFEALTGQSPFLDKKGFVQTLMKVCNHRQPSARELNHEVPEEVAALVDFLLEKDPAHRPQDATEVVIALSHLAGIPYHPIHLEPQEREPRSSWTEEGNGFEPSATRIAPAGLRQRLRGLRAQSSRLTDSKVGIFIKTLVVVDLADREQVESELGRYVSFMFFARHDRILRDLSADYGGEELGKRGAFLLMFERPSDAVRFALDYRRQLAELCRQNDDLEQVAGIAIHLGEVYEMRSGERFEVEERSAQVLRRAAILAGDGRILLTQEARDLSRQVLESDSGSREETLHWLDHGLYHLAEGQDLTGLSEVSEREILPLTSGDSDSISRPAPVLGGHSGPARRRRIGWIAAMLTVAILAGAGIVRWGFLDGWLGNGGAASNVGDEAPVGRISVAVIGFQNRSGKEADGWLSTALAELFSTELAADGRLRLLPGEVVARTRAELDLEAVEFFDAETVERISRNLSADYILIGAYNFKDDQTLDVVLHLQDTTNGELVATVRDKRQERELFELVTSAGERLRTELDLATPDASDAALRAVRTALPSDADARRLYSQGLARLRSFDALAARELLEQAIAAEPGFPLSHSALAEALAALGYDQQAQESAARAFELASKVEDLPGDAELIIEGRFYEAATDWDRAVAIYNLLRERAPDNLEYGLRLAEVQVEAGFGDDALDTIAELRRTIEEAASDPRVDLAEASAAQLKADYELMRKALKRAVANGRARGALLLVAEARWLEGRTLSRQGSAVDEARGALNEALEQFDRAGNRGRTADVLLDIGLIMENAGETTRAEDLYERGLAIHRETGNRRGISMALQALGILARDRGDLKVAKELFQQVTDIAVELGNRRLEGYYLCTISQVVLQQGDIAGAEMAAQKVEELSESIGNRELAAWSYFLQGQIAYVTGELLYARALYEQMLNITIDRARALALRSLAEVHLASGDLESAWKLSQEAVEIYVELEDSDVYLAHLLQIRILHERGQDQAAEDLARRVGAEFDRRRVADPKAAVQLALARVLMSQGRYDEAWREIVAARSYADGGSQRPAFRIEVAVVEAQLLTKKEQYKEAFKRLEEAEQLLSDVWVQDLEHELHYARGLAEIASGQEGRGRELLGQVIREAELDDYGLVAGWARKALSTL